MRSIGVGVIVGLTIALASGCFSSSPPPRITPTHSSLEQSVCQRPTLPKDASLSDAFAPTADGRIKIIHTSGQTKLSALGITAWSEDNALVGFAGLGAITLWNTQDGTLAEQHSCPGQPIASGALVLSKDGQWIAHSGVRPSSEFSPPATCVVHRPTGRSFVVDALMLGQNGIRDELVFNTATPKPTLEGLHGSIDLATGQYTRRNAPHPLLWLLGAEGAHVLAFKAEESQKIPLVLDARTSAIVAELPPVQGRHYLTVSGNGERIALFNRKTVSIYALPDGKPIARIDNIDSHAIRLSPDGSKLAGWTLPVVTWGGSKPTDEPPPESFVEMWDVTSQRRLWRNPGVCCSRWRFSQNGLYLEAEPGRLPDTNIRASDGKAITYAGYPAKLSPNGERLIVFADDGNQIWSSDGQLLLAPPRTRPVVTRGGERGDMVVSNASHDRHSPLLFEHGDRCVHLGIRSPHPGLAFTQDHSLIYASVSSHSKTLLHTWQTHDGRYTRTLETVPKHLQYLPYQDTLALRNRDEEYNIYSIDGQHLKTTDHTPSACDDSFIADLNLPPKTEHWSVATPPPKFSPDCTRLALPRNNTVTVYDTSTRQPIGTVTLKADAARAVWWSHDNATLIIDTHRRFMITTSTL